MNKVTDETTYAFATQKKNFTMGNSSVHTDINQSEQHTEYRLFGNLIAELKDYHVYRYKRLKLNNCNYYTQVTKRRLNGILEQFGLGRIIQKNFERFYQNTVGELTPFNGRLEFEFDALGDNVRKPFTPKEN